MNAPPGNPKFDLESGLLPTWVDWDAPLIARPELLYPLPGGNSHNTWLVSGLCADGPEQQFVVRLESPHSRSLAVSAAAEVSAMKACPDLAPAVVYRGNEVLVTRFVDLPHWQPPQDLALLGHKLAHLHEAPLPREVEHIDLVARCQAYHQRLGTLGAFEPLYQRALEHTRLGLARFSERSLCHNDLNPTNLLAGDGRLVLLDWEYCGVNCPAFDLASLAEFGRLDDAQVRVLSAAYGAAREGHDPSHALHAMRPVVRLLEWLWLRLQGLPEEASRRRLQVLLAD